MLEEGKSRRGRLGGARDAHRAADTRGGRCPLGARQVFALQDFFQPRLEEPVLSICSSTGKGVAQLLCLTSPIPGLAFPQKRGRSSSHPGEVNRGAASWGKPLLHPRSSCLLLAARVASPSLSSVPSGRTPPCRGAVGQGLPHGGARTIWEGAHVTLAGRERHVKGSAEALFGSGVAAESPARGPRPHPVPDPSSRGNRAMGRGPQGWFLRGACPESG